MPLPGILGTLRLAGVLVIAMPLLLFGLERLVAGRPSGLAFVALGVLVVGLDRLLLNPLDPTDLAEESLDRSAGRVLEAEGSEDSSSREE